mgnify:CR=1 FL=1
MVRPIVEAGEKLGFLPGDFKDKVDMENIEEAINHINEYVPIIKINILIIIYKIIRWNLH